MGMLPQTWTSNEQSDGNPEDWYGIAGPVTAGVLVAALVLDLGLPGRDGLERAEVTLVGSGKLADNVFPIAKLAPDATTKLTAAVKAISEALPAAPQM